MPDWTMMDTRDAVLSSAEPSPLSWNTHCYACRLTRSFFLHCMQTSCSPGAQTLARTHTPTYTYTYESLFPCWLLQKSSPRDELYQWQDAMEEQRANELVLQKKEIKEKDGFCRRVDNYDGSIITIDGECSWFVSPRNCYCFCISSQPSFGCYFRIRLISRTVS